MTVHSRDNTAVMAVCNCRRPYPRMGARPVVAGWPSRVALALRVVPQRIELEVMLTSALGCAQVNMAEGALFGCTLRM
jgi:hypothetical protein